MRGSRAHRVESRAWPGYSAQKNYAASIAANDWILSLDADERVTPELAAEIQHLLASEPRVAATACRASRWYLGRWIRTTDWYPDYQLRLYDRRGGQWTGATCTSRCRLTGGEPGHLHHELQHFAYRDISDHLATIDRYTTLAAQQWTADGRARRSPALVAHPPFAFVRNYLLRRGFMDGRPGCIVSALNSYYVFLKLAKLWELNRTRGSRAEATARGVRISSRQTDRR